MIRLPRLLRWLVSHYDIHLLHLRHHPIRMIRLLHQL
jgi:hypothetical protein